MSRVGETMPTEYSDKFDEYRQNRCEVSYYKYGPADINFKYGLVDAIESMKLCVEKYLETGNTEYLCDGANYLMYEYMYPRVKGAKFKPTDSKDSAGVVGKPIGNIKGDGYLC